MPYFQLGNSARKAAGRDRRGAQEAYAKRLAYAPVIADLGRGPEAIGDIGPIKDSSTTWASGTSDGWSSPTGLCRYIHICRCRDVAIHLSSALATGAAGRSARPPTMPSRKRPNPKGSDEDRKLRTVSSRASKAVKERPLFSADLRPEQPDRHVPRR